MFKERNSRISLYFFKESSRCYTRAQKKPGFDTPFFGPPLGFTAAMPFCNYGVFSFYEVV